MKNIHVLPTDKPSRLLYNFTLKSFCIQTEKDGMFINDGNVAGADFWSIEKANNNGFRYINIYITSDEEIKEGDYFLYDETEIRYKTNGTEYHGRDLCHISGNRRYPVNKSKKIILTTDQDLIADGVQAVEEDFLNWFVKNPSCEEVEVEHIKVDDARPSGYKISIQKEEPKQTDWKESTKALMEAYGDNPKDFPYEEPKIISDWLEQNRNPEIDKQVEKEAEELSKQETLVRDYSNRSCQTCNLFNANNDGEKACELELESECASYSNDETLEDFWISCLDDESDSVLYKQETLEEVAERLYPTDYGEKSKNIINIIKQEAFIRGAKWQQEQNKNLYSEEQMDDAYDKGFNDAIDKQWLDKFKNK